MVRIYFRYRFFIDLLSTCLICVLTYIYTNQNYHLFVEISVDKSQQPLNSIFQVSSSLLGFVLASVTFLFYHIKNPEFLIIRNSRSYRDLLDLFSSAIWRLLFLTIVSLLASISSKYVINIWVYFTLFVAVMALTSLCALIWVTIRILKVTNY